MVTTDLLAFVSVSIPVMMVLGFRHALDIDHITAIDNLLRLHNTKRNSKWVGSGFNFWTYDGCGIRDDSYNYGDR